MSLYSASRRATSRFRRLQLQPLEPRTVLAPFTVSTLADESDGNFAAGDFSLRECIEQANLTTAADTISFQSGLTGSITLSGSGLFVTEDVTISGPGPAGTITISGSDTVRPFYFFNNSNPVVASMSGLGIIKGNAVGFAGGAIAVDPGASLSLSRMLLFNNDASQGGAVVAIGATLSIVDSTFFGNQAADGGAVAAFSASTVTLNRCALASNVATNNGGGVSTSNSSLIVLNSTLSFNSGQSSSGGIFHDGGGTHDVANPTLRVINSTIAENHSSGNAGGVYVFDGAAQFRNATITRNRADENNTSGGTGGGVFVSNNADSSATLFNTIVAGNTRAGFTTPNDISTNKNLESASAYNLIGDAATAGGLAHGGTNHNLVGNSGSGTIDINTVLQSIDSNGGPTPTYSLKAGSPALDAGNNALALNQNGAALTTDQRGSGFPRIADGPDAGTVATVDIGAFESRQQTYLVDTLEGADDNDFAVGDLSLSEAIKQANANAGPETINFAAGLIGTISTTDELSITESVVVNGPGADRLAINGSGNHSLLLVIDAGSVVLSGLAMHDGFVNGSGGGIGVSGSSLTLNRMHLHDNLATSNGGGIVILGSELGSPLPTIVTILNSTINKNTAAGGGGIAQFGTGGDAPIGLRVINSSISGNNSLEGEVGGGVRVFDGTATFRNSTITANVSEGDGGGIETRFASTTLFNTIIAGNLVKFAGNFFPNDLFGSVDPSSANNLVGNAATAGGLTHGNNGNIVGVNGSGTIDINTVLDTTLADNGGPTPTHLLVPGSPAIDKGQNSLALDPNGIALSTDQRGRTRIVDRDGNGTATVDIGAVELAAFSLSLSGSITYTENGEPLILASGATFSAVDSSTFNNGKLTVTNAVSPHADDRLIVRHQGTGAGQVSTSGSDVSYGGVLIGTKTGGAGSTPLVVTFNGSATAAAIQAVVRRVAFSSVSDNPPTSARSIRFSIKDGQGSFSKTVSKTVNVVRVNDPPVIGSFGSAVTYTEDTPAIGIAVLATVSDADSFNYDGGKLSARISANAESSDRLSIRNLGSVSTSGSEVIAGGEVVGTFAGGSGSTALVVTFNILANSSDVQAVLRALTFRNSSQNPSPSARTLSVFVTDGDGGTSATSTKLINVTPTNDAPALGGISGSIGYVHDATAIVLAGSATVSDVDSANFGGGRLRVRITDGASNSNRLGIGGGFTVDGSNNVLLNGVIIGTRVSNGFGTNELIITFNTSATKAIVQQLVRAITFKTVNGAAGQRKVVFTVSDGDGGVSEEKTKTVNVT